MTDPLVIDLQACLTALDSARVIDFTRYVARRMDEEPSLQCQPFRVGWDIVLGGYAQLATNNYTTTGEGDERE